MDKQAIFNKIQAHTGQDFSRNRGIKSYLAMLNKDKRAGASVSGLHKAFLAVTDEVTAMAAALVCANRYLNGAQISGFGNYWEFNYTLRKRFPRPGATRTRDYLLPEEQLSAVISNPEQTLKTFKAIKPETLERYRQIVILTNQTRKEHQNGNQNQTLDL